MSRFVKLRAAMPEQRSSLLQAVTLKAVANANAVLEHQPFFIVLQCCVASDSCSQLTDH